MAMHFLDSFWLHVHRFAEMWHFYVYLIDTVASMENDWMVLTKGKAALQQPPCRPRTHAVCCVGLEWLLFSTPFVGF